MAQKNYFFSLIAHLLVWVSSHYFFACFRGLSSKNVDETSCMMSMMFILFQWALNWFPGLRCGCFIISLRELLARLPDLYQSPSVSCVIFVFSALIGHWLFRSKFREICGNFLMTYSGKGGFPLGEMTGDFASKSRRNYFATKLYLIFTWTTLARFLRTFINVKLNWE